MARAVVDVQFFRTGSKNVTPKELAVFDGTHVAHYVFKPPFAFSNLEAKLQTEASWVEANHHCILWTEGLVPVYLFKQLMNRAVQDVNILYVKGLEKAAFVRANTAKTVLELPEDIPLVRTEPSCFYHNRQLCYCALSNVYSLFNNYIML